MLRTPDEQRANVSEVVNRIDAEVRRRRAHRRWGHAAHGVVKREAPGVARAGSL